MRYLGRGGRAKAWRQLGAQIIGTALLVLVVSVLVGLTFKWVQERAGDGGGLSPVPLVDGGAIGTTAALPGAVPSWAVSPWVYLACVLLVLVVVGIFVYWRTSYLERIRDRLERQVAERTSEVQRQKHQLTVYNRELLRSNEQLRQTVEEKSKLLGVAAHDLKNPLFGIRALSEIVLENEELGPRVARKMNLIRESADEAMTLIDDLLASAASSAQTDADTELIDLGTLAQWVVHSFEPHAQRKDQVLHCTVADEACVVEGSKRKLREAIGNLVSNALKYSPPGEEVGVTVVQTDGMVEVTVMDDGPGLSEADQQRMFAPFQRLTPNPTGEESSSGLGLYIVKQVVDFHDGEIEVDSALGEGSTFRVFFPVVEADADSVPEADPSEVGQVA